MSVSGEELKENFLGQKMKDDKIRIGHNYQEYCLSKKKNFSSCD